MKPILYILLTIILYSCYTVRAPRRVDQFFKYEPSIIQTSLCGIYKNIDHKGWTSYILFYSDGTCVGGINDRYFDTDSMDINGFLKNAEEDSVLKHLFLRMSNWGYYTISNDTIFTYIIRGKLKENPFWDIFESSYKISYGGNQIELIQSKWIDAFKDDHFTIDTNKVTYHFVDTFNCKESNTWLKYQDWFWKNEMDFNDWIKYKTGVDITNDKKALKKIKTP